MPRPISLNNHSGGLKTNLSPFLYEKHESPHNYNVDTTSNLGAVSKAKHYYQFSSDAGSTAIQGIMPFENVNGQTKIFMATNGTIYEDVDGTWTSRHTGVENNKNVESVVFYNRLYVANELKGLRYTDNGVDWQTSVVNEDSTSIDWRPKFVEVFRDRLYAANFGGTDNNQRNRFAFSDLGDGTTFNSDNLIDTIENPITGMKATFNGVYLFTDRSFWRWDNSYLLKVDNEGTESHRSIAAGASRLFFANKTGVWESTGGRPKFISRPIQWWWDDIIPTNFSKLNGVYHNNEYYLWIGDSRGKSDVVLVYSTLFETWRVLTNWPSNVMATWSNESNEKNIYFGNNTSDSIIYKTDDVYEQNNVRVESLYEYPHLFPAGIDKESYGRSLHCFAQCNGQVTFTVEYQLDSDGTWHELGNWSLDGTGGIEKHVFDLDNTVVGYSIKFRIKESNSGDAWQWHGMRYYSEGRRGVND